MTHQLYLRVFSLSGLGAEHIRRFPKGKVSISAELGNAKANTARAAFGSGSVKVDQVSWSAADGLLKWEVSDDELQQLKAVQPKIKLFITVHADSTGRNASQQTADAGYVLIDMRDLSRGEIKQQVYKTHGMQGGEVTLSCKLNATAHVQRHPTRVLGSATDGDVSNIRSSVQSNPSVGASTDSIRSVLRLALAGDSSSKNTHTATAVRFSLAVALQDYHSLNALCEAVVTADREACSGSDYGRKQAAIDAAKDRSFWLCWTVFEKMFQSSEFQYGMIGPKRVRDTIRVECPLASVQTVVKEASPLRIFLCTQGQILGVANVPLPDLAEDAFAGEDMDAPVLSAEGWTSFSPQTQDTQQIGKALALPAPTDPSTAGLKLSLSLCFDSIIPGDDAEAEEEYADEGFEDAEVKSPHVRFADDSSSVQGASEGAATASAGFSSGLDEPTAPDTSVPSPHERKPPGMYEEGQEGEGEGNGIHDDADDDSNLRHFRVSIDIKSLSGFKRPAQVAVMFAYPHLGTAAPVRTLPVWVMANSEVRVDGGTASYECCMTRANIRQKLREHALKVQCLSRSNLGSTAMGEANLDLSATLATSPHTYRCPSTGRNFKSRAEYSRHRQTLLALFAAGRLSTPAPAVDPVYVRMSDSFVHLQRDGAPDSARMRAVVIIEDLGVVGSKQSVNVKPGYASNGVGVYVGEGDEQEYVDEAEAIAAGGGMIKNPLDKAEEEMTPVERKRLEMLQLEWEGWRKHAEQQWRDMLAQKEQALRKRLEAEANASLSNRADDLRRAHEESGRLEVRLRAAIDTAERQSSQLSLKQESMNLKLAQKTGELQLLQKRMRDEAKVRVDAEKHRADSLASQLGTSQIDLARMEKRARESEKEYEQYRANTRSLPENILREEAARLKAQLAESRAEIERERRIRSEAELEKEHYRSQMHRLALALKREREKSSTLARQELEQLRLEFLAREERYVLDGDREELRTIRHELANLRTGPPAPPPAPVQQTTNNYNLNSGSSRGNGPAANAARIKEQLSVLLSTGLYDEADSVVQTLQANLAQVSVSAAE